MTMQEFMRDVMFPLWMHKTKPRSEYDQTQIAEYWFDALKTYDLADLIVAVKKVIEDDDGYRVPTLSVFKRLIPPRTVAVDRRIAAPAVFAPVGPPPPGLLRYITIACGGRKNVFVNALRGAAKGDSDQDCEVLPKVAGDTYLERLRNCVPLAESENIDGILDRTIAVLTGASQGE